jgi:hypothetical protein
MSNTTSIHHDFYIVTSIQNKHYIPEAPCFVFSKGILCGDQSLLRKFINPRRGFRSHVAEVSSSAVCCADSLGEHFPTFGMTVTPSSLGSSRLSKHREILAQQHSVKSEKPVIFTVYELEDELRDV